MCAYDSDLKRSGTTDDLYFASSGLRGTEAIVTGLFKVVLNRQDLGVDDNLFAHGLTSLQVVELVSRINHTFDTRVSDATICGHPTARAMAAWLQNTANISTETSSDLCATEESAREPADASRDKFE
jgi:aryl carrier-like protein